MIYSFSSLPHAYQSPKVDRLGLKLGSAIYQLGNLEDAAYLPLYQLPSATRMLLNKQLQNFDGIQE